MVGVSVEICIPNGDYDRLEVWRMDEGKINRQIRCPCRTLIEQDMVIFVKNIVKKLAEKLEGETVFALFNVRITVKNTLP